MKELLNAIARNAVGLGLFALVTAGAIAVTQMLTAERIEHNILQAQAKALNELIPVGSYDNELMSDTVALNQFDSSLLGPVKASDVIYVARQQGQVSTLLMPVVAPDGYTQEIRMLVAINANGEITGVRITEHRETPGLGDKIDLKRDPWVLSFNGKQLTNPDQKGWAVKKDGGEFDQFTGATITPRAVVKAVKNALVFFEKNKAVLLNPANNGVQS